MAYNLQILPYSRSGLAASSTDISQDKRLALICDAVAALVKGVGKMKHVKKGMILVVILMVATVGTGVAAFHMYELLWFNQSNDSSSSVAVTSSTVSAGGFRAPAGIGAAEGGFASSEGALSQKRLFTLSEPAVMLLFGVGLVGLAQLVRKRNGRSSGRE